MELAQLSSRHISELHCGFCLVSSARWPFVLKHFIKIDVQYGNYWQCYSLSVREIVSAVSMCESVMAVPSPSLFSNIQPAFLAGAHLSSTASGFVKSDLVCRWRWYPVCQTRTWYDKDAEHSVHDILTISGEIWPSWQDFKTWLMLTHSLVSLFSYCLQRF